MFSAVVGTNCSWPIVSAYSLLQNWTHARIIGLLLLTFPLWCFLQYVFLFCFSFPWVLLVGPWFSSLLSLWVLLKHGFLISYLQWSMGIDFHSLWDIFYFFPLMGTIEKVFLPFRGSFYWSRFSKKLRGFCYSLYGYKSAGKTALTNGLQVHC